VASTSRATNRVTGTTTRATQGSGGGEAVTRTVRKGPEASPHRQRRRSPGRDGKVYKKNDGGGWSRITAAATGTIVQLTAEQRQQAQQRVRRMLPRAARRAIHPP
jgi:hypothetical protein